MRQAIYDALRGDALLNTMGVAPDGANLYPNFSADSPAGDPAQQRFLVIQYGAGEPHPAPGVDAKAFAVSLWVYDREPTFAVVAAILRRARTVLEALGGTRFTGGAFLGVSFAFSSDDSWDDAYSAVLRSETFRVVASGQ